MAVDLRLTAAVDAQTGQEIEQRALFRNRSSRLKRQNRYTQHL
jgi:hypothetical protein